MTSLPNQNKLATLKGLASSFKADAFKPKESLNTSPSLNAQLKRKIDPDYIRPHKYDLTSKLFNS